MNRYLALLRGVNLGSRRVAMADLRVLLVELGYENVATYVQSGNAVFDAADDREAVRSTVEEALAGTFGFEVPTVLVTLSELDAVIAGCPFPDAATADPTKVHVVFCDRLPSADRLSQVATGCDPEQAVVGERVIYMHLPDGMARARLPQAVDRATSGVLATTRNWRSVVNLRDLLAR